MTGWNASRPVASSRTTTTGVELVIDPTPPAIAAWSWAAPNRISPRSASAAASSGVVARPSARAAPIMPPRSSSDISSQGCGGAACSTSPGSSPGTTSPAGRTATTRGWTASIRAIAVASGEPGGGGRTAIRANYRSGVLSSVTFAGGAGS